ncbi:MAG: hypothetical protein IJZ88_03700 [Clostridia bacterium]|nr:hypothetical protein [Clostridia bacterium]
MKFKKFISIFLVLAMLISVASVSAMADSSHVANYDRDTPVVIVHGMSQNDTYVLDENGERIPDEIGYVTGWPLEIDVMALVKVAIIPLIMSVFTQKDCGLTDAFRQGAYDGLPYIHKDAKGNYIADVEVPCYEYPMSEMTEELKAYYYNILPLQDLSKIVGEESVYYFGYDSFGSVMGETEKLHHYIHDVVLPQTGADQVRLCHISLGGTIGVNYLETYPEDYDLIKRMEFVVPAIDGSDIIGDILTGNLSVFYSDDVLYGELLPTLLGDTYLAYLLNMVLRVIPDDVLKSALGGLLEGLISAGVRSTTLIWALCPTDYYEEARALWLEDEEYADIAAEVDYYMNARANFPENIAALKASGTPVFDIVCHGGGMFPLCKDYNVTNGDGIVHAESASMGATFANVGETLGDGYKAVGTYCSDPTHNHISPDNTVDATTGLLPCTTWYISHQAHEKLPMNDVALKMAFDIMTDDNMVDVYSNPEVYPQFNEGRLTKEANEYLAAWEDADKSALTAEQIEAVEKAVAEVNKQLGETVVNNAAWLAAVEDLRVALVNAGVIEDTAPTEIEKIFTQITKYLNQGVNQIFNFVNA